MRTRWPGSSLPDRPAIVVVDNAAQADTAALIRHRYPHVVLVQAPANLGAAGRNLGVAVARTRYVAFCDDDTWWAPGSMEQAADLLDAYPHVASVTARVLVGPDQREDPTCRLMADSPLDAPVTLPGRPILGLLAGATAFRRDAFMQAGGYHPRYFLGGEEALLALDLYRAGGWLVYAPRLTVHHHPSPQRDARTRARVTARNAVWTAWLRWPAPPRCGRPCGCCRACGATACSRARSRAWRGSCVSAVRSRRTWNACAASLNAMRVGMRATEHERGGTIRNPVFPHRRPVARAGCRSSSG